MDINNVIDLDNEEPQNDEQNDERRRQRQQNDFVPTDDQLCKLLVFNSSTGKHVCCICIPSFVGHAELVPSLKLTGNTEYAPKGNTGNSFSQSAKDHVLKHKNSFKSDKQLFLDLSKLAAAKAAEANRVVFEADNNAVLQPKAIQSSRKAEVAQENSYKSLKDCILSGSPYCNGPASSKVKSAYFSLKKKPE